MAPGTSNIHRCKGQRASSRVAVSLRAGSLLVLALLAGCSGRNTYITGGPSTGQLKSSLSHVEFENEQLKTQVARLKEENRAFEDRLDQERLHNDELITKLDAARNRLRDDGFDVDRDLDAPVRGPKTLPAGRATPPKRKSPAAQISRSREVDEIPPIRIEEAPRERRSSRPARTTTQPHVDEGDSLGMSEQNLNWIPIARGQEAPAAAPKR